MAFAKAGRSFRCSEEGEGVSTTVARPPIQVKITVLKARSLKRDILILTGELLEDCWSVKRLVERRFEWKRDSESYLNALT